MKNEPISPTLDVFLNKLRATVTNTGGQRQAAANLGVSAALVNSVLNGHLKPPLKLLAAMGYERVTVYRKAKP